jgi:3-hydroxyisobutyrate dehydrogenase-like beta-hydroxyacid dehydrogenase
MTLNKIAIISPGDMGSAVGGLLVSNGAEVYTCLQNRSQRTKSLSEAAGITDLPDFNELVTTVDVVLSITVSEIVQQVCEEVAKAAQATGSFPIFAECNAISPNKSKQLQAILESAGCTYIDASIIGGPPARGDTTSGVKGKSPHIYYSGENTEDFSTLTEVGLDLKYLGSNIGQASAIKMTYAALTKGSTALYTELMLAAQIMGVSDQLAEEFTTTQSDAYTRMAKWIPTMPAKARRWVSEMKEIQATFEELNMTGHIFEGVSEMYDLIGGTPLGNETPESQDRSRTLSDTLDQLASFIK